MYFRNKPKMELVLWRPPGNVIRNIITSSIESDATSEEQSDQPESSSSERTRPTEASAAITEESANPTERGMSDSSNGSSPDSGVSLSSPPLSLSFLNSTYNRSGRSSSNGAIDDDVLSLPSTSGLEGTRSSAGGYSGPWNRPASPVPEPMAEDDVSDRMEFNNNNGNATNYMWLEENNNSALIDLNVIGRYNSVPVLDDLPDLPDSDDMDL